MRILVCSVEAPCPPVNGLRLIVDALTSELVTSHDVLTLAFPAKDQDPAGARARADLRLLPPPRHDVGARVGRVATSTLRRRPFSASAARHAMRGAVREALAEFRPDVVHVTNGKLAGLADDLAGIPAVIAPIDAWYRGVNAAMLAAPRLHRPLLRVEARNVARFEARMYRRFDTTIVVSDAERDALLQLDPTLRVEVIPNGVDTTKFAPGPDRDRGHRLVYTGVMRYGPNVADAEVLARELLPRVRRHLPGATLALVGRQPSKAVRALGTLPGVEVTGEVADVRDWLVSSDAFVCPASVDLGVKNKLLEAMACGVPTVVAPTALGGLRAVPGRDLLVGATLDAMVALVVDLLRDPDRATALGTAARRYVAEVHSWPKVAAQYEAVYRAAVARAVSS